MKEGHYWAKRVGDDLWTVVYYSKGHLIVIGSADIKKEAEYVFGPFIEKPPDQPAGT